MPSTSPPLPPIPSHPHSNRTIKITCHLIHKLPHRRRHKHPFLKKNIIQQTRRRQFPSLGAIIPFRRGDIISQQDGFTGSPLAEPVALLLAVQGLLGGRVERLGEVGGVEFVDVGEVGGEFPA